MYRSVLKELVEEWNFVDDEAIKIDPITEGTTNKLYKCQVEADNRRKKHSVLFRLHGSDSEVLIDRDAELHLLQHLSLVEGLAPRIWGRTLNGLVYDYIEGSVLTLETVREGQVPAAVATHLATFHTFSPNLSGGGRKKNAYFERLYQWHRLLSDETKETGFSFSFLEEEIHWAHNLVEALGLNQQELVLCHNDLQPRNIVLLPNNKDIRFIDMEYSSYGWPAYDLVNYFSEFCGILPWDETLYPSLEERISFISAYLAALHRCPVDAVQAEVLQRLVEEVDALQCLPHLFWGVWALVQNKHSDIAFSFEEYAEIRLGMYQKLKRNSCRSLDDSEKDKQHRR